MEGNNYLDPVQMLKKEREEFIAKRAVEEKNFNDWYASLLKCSEKFRSEIPFSYEGWTLQNQVPEWYVDNPNKEIASQQVKSLWEKINQINLLADAYNRRGLELKQKMSTM